MDTAKAGNKLLEMAARIREMREIIGYTVAQMAEKTGVSEAEYQEAINEELEFVRGESAFVPQTSRLFSGTVAENIRWGKPDATEEEVRAAARTAGADRFITRLRDGYNTVVSDNGGNLSAGQRQLLALARAVLSDPPILILDEATSALDLETEQRLLHNLKQMFCGQQTVIFITHRIAVYEHCDQVLKLERQ